MDELKRDYPRICDRSILLGVTNKNDENKNKKVLKTNKTDEFKFYLPGKRLCSVKKIISFTYLDRSPCTWTFNDSL